MFLLCDVLKLAVSRIGRRSLLLPTAGHNIPASLSAGCHAIYIFCAIGMVTKPTQTTLPVKNAVRLMTNAVRFCHWDRASGKGGDCLTHGALTVHAVTICPDCELHGSYEIAPDGGLDQLTPLTPPPTPHRPFALSSCCHPDQANARLG